MKWVIDNINETSELEGHLKELEIPVYNLSSKERILTPSSIDTFIDCDEPIMFHGTLEDAKFLQRKNRKNILTFADLDRFKCSNYYHYYNHLLLNYPYSFVLFKDLKNKKMMNKLISSFGNNGCIFVRPDDGAKSFTGRIIDIRSWEKDIDSLSFNDIPDSTLCLVSEPVNIESEYRLWIGDGKVIGYSMYQPVKMNVCMDETIKFAEEAAKLYQPERLFVMDVCRASIEYSFPTEKIMEINSFGCSGFYKVDIPNMINQAIFIGEKFYD